MIKLTDISKIANNIAQKISSSPSKIIEPAEKIVDETVSTCLDSVGRAQIALSKNISLVPETEEEVLILVEKILKQKDMILNEHSFEEHIRGGRKIEGFDNLCYDEIRGKCIRNPEGFVDKILLMDTANRSVNVYNSKGSITKRYNSLDMETLHKYKYSPDFFHSRLRYNKINNGISDDEFTIHAYTLNNLFQNPNTNYVTKEPTVVYRALQNILNEEQQHAICTEGSIFHDASYISTSRELKTAQRFKGKNPILEITLPKGTKHLDLDELFNIDKRNWREQEILLPCKSNFLINGYNSENDTIKALYLGSE